jgi:hypothetical protein
VGISLASPSGSGHGALPSAAELAPLLSDEFSQPVPAALPGPRALKGSAGRTSTHLKETK